MEKMAAAAKTLSRAANRSRLRLYYTIFLIPGLVSMVLFVQRPTCPLSPKTTLPVLTRAYDPAATLGISSFLSNLQETPSELRVVLPYPAGSLVARYLSRPRTCTGRLYVPDLRAALDDLRGAVSLPASALGTTALHVQVLCGTPGRDGTSLSSAFLRGVREVSQRFGRVAILPIRAAGSTERSCVRDEARVLAAVAPGSRAYVLRAGSVDRHLLLSANAQDLVLHRGAHSALAGLLSTRRTYSTADFAEYTGRNAFRWLLAAHTVVDSPPRGAERFLLDRMGPVTPSCCALRAFGTGDGEKVLCANAPAFENAATKVGGGPCWVLSLGCGGRWHFEDAVTQRTRCYVRTFDCTRNFTVPDRLAGRVTIHKYCLGSRGGPFRRGSVGWQTVLDIAAKANPESMPRIPAVVKMDIEGYEMPAMYDILDGGEDSVPVQIAMEFHNGGVRYLPKELGTQDTIEKWFGRLAKVGYRIVHRADNPGCDSCSEITLVRDIGLPSGS